MTSTFRVLYVLVVMEHHSRRLIHFNVTAHPIFSAELDESIQRLGLRVLKSPPQPKGEFHL